MEITQLETVAREIRKKIVTMLAAAGSGHPGGSLSAVELMVGLYFKHINFDPANPRDPKRDYFILSKGHVCPVLYAVLAQLGLIREEELATLRKPGSRLQGHPAFDKGIPGVEVSTGSLGQGLSIAVGTALAQKKEGLSSRTYVMMGDGEQQEGSIWEAAMAAGHYKLDNLCAIIDYNKLQIDGQVEDVMGIAPLTDKYRSFRWNVIEINGHDLAAVVTAYGQAKQFKGMPTVIIAHTVKGKGVSFMENKADWHGKTPNKDQLAQALKEIEGK